MSLSKTATTEEKGGKVKKEHWTQKLKREHSEALHHIVVLQDVLKKNQIELPSLFGGGVATVVQRTSDPSSLPSLFGGTKGGYRRDGGDGGDDGDGDDVPEEDPQGFVFKVVIVYEEVEHIIYPTDSDEPINCFKYRLQGKFDVPHISINLSVSETGRDVEDDDPDALLLDYFVNDGDDTIKFDMVVEDENLHGFYFIEVVEMFGNRGRYRVLIDNDMVRLDLPFIISGKVGIPSEAISVYHNDIYILDYTQFWEMNIGADLILHFGVSGSGGMPSNKRKAVSMVEMKPKPTDPPRIQQILSLQEFKSRAWLETLALTSLKDYLKEIDARKSTPQLVSSTMSRIGEYETIKSEVFEEKNTLP